MTPLSKIWLESGGVRATYVAINRVNQVILHFLRLLLCDFGPFSPRGFPLAATSRLRVFGGHDGAVFLV
jgi:hypothetical protein